MYMLCIDNSGFPLNLISKVAYKVSGANTPEDTYKVIDNSGEEYIYAQRRFRFFLTFSEAVNVADKQGLKIQCCKWKNNNIYLKVVTRTSDNRRILEEFSKNRSYILQYNPSIEDILSSWIIIE